MKATADQLAQRVEHYKETLDEIINRLAELNTERSYVYARSALKYREHEIRRLIKYICLRANNDIHFSFDVVSEKCTRR